MDESFLRLVIILCTTTIIFIISCCWGFVFSPKERKIILSASMSLLKEIKGSYIFELKIIVAPKLKGHHR